MINNNANSQFPIINPNNNIINSINSNIININQSNFKENIIKESNNRNDNENNLPIPIDNNSGDEQKDNRENEKYEII